MGASLAAISGASDGAPSAGDVLIELGIVLLVLALLGRLAQRIGISSIPLYLLGGLALGKGGIIPISAGDDFIGVGAEIGVVLLLLLLGLEYSPQDLRDGLRSTWLAGIIDVVANAAAGLRRGADPRVDARRRRCCSRGSPTSRRRESSRACSTTSTASVTARRPSC